MRQLLGRRDFRRLLLGQAVSSLGDWMGTLALLYFVLELSGSTTAVGAVLVLRLLPSAIGAPLAARAVTRWNRRQVMLTSDLLRGGMAVLLPVLPWLGWVYFWAFVIEMVSLAFLPARDSAIPFLLAKNDGKKRKEDETNTLALANGVTMGLQYGMIPLGAGAFGLILLLSDQMGWTGHWRYVVVFWLDALTYLISYLIIRRIPDLDARTRKVPAGEPHRANPATTESGIGPHLAHGRITDPLREDRADPTLVPAGQNPGSADHSAPEGISAALRIPLVRAILPGIAVVALGLGSLFSLGVVFVNDVLNAGPLGFGVLVALFGVGAAIGLSVLRRGAGGALIAQIRLGIIAQGLVVAMMGVLATVAWAFVAAVIFGAAATAALIGGITYFQENLQGVRRNLALTAFHAALRLGLAISALASGVAADLVGEVRLGPLGTLAPTQTVLIGSGLVILLGSLLVRSPGPRPGTAGVPGKGRDAGAADDPPRDP